MDEIKLKSTTTISRINKIELAIIREDDGMKRTYKLDYAESSVIGNDIMRLMEHMDICNANVTEELI